jgi:FHA domain
MKGKKEKAMVNRKRMCPSGHVIPAEAVICPICDPGSARGAEGMDAPAALTRVDFDSEATRVEQAANPLLEENRPFCGWLAVIDGNLSGEAFHLYKGRNIIGSSSPCDIQMPDEGVQSQHLSVRFSSGHWTLTDLDSDAGTFLNGKLVHRTELDDGDKITIGKAGFRIKIL